MFDLMPYLLVVTGNEESLSLDDVSCGNQKSHPAGFRETSTCWCGLHLITRPVCAQCSVFRIGHFLKMFVFSAETLGMKEFAVVGHLAG